MEKVKKILKHENIIYIFILFIISIFICLPLLNNKLDMSYDDGVQHITRLMGTYQSIKEGQPFPVIMSNFCNEFGYSWNLFYSPLTAYIPLIFKLLGVSFTTCIKLFMFFVIFISGITMYFFVYELTNNKKVALLSGVFYIFAPYRFTDMYARYALAELTTFVFLPMVFHGLYGIFKQKNKREYLLIIGTICLILTHTIVTMYTAIICFIYCLTQLKNLKIKDIRRNIIFSLIMILLITSFFLVPLLEHKFASNYEVFKPGRMERTDVLIYFKLSLLELFITPKENIMIYEIGLVSIILLILSPIVIKKIKEEKQDLYHFYIFSLIVGLICIIMTLKIFPFEYLPSILKMIQFSFRLLEFSSFFFAFIVALNFEKILQKFKMELKLSDILVITSILMILSSLYVSHLHFKEENFDETKYWPAVRITKYTGRVHAGCASFEYLPCKAFENRAYIETRTNDVVVLEGNATIENIEKSGTNLSCKIKNVEDDVVIELPYIYYLGYNVTLSKNEDRIKLETFETANGFVGVKLPQTQSGVLRVKYEGTSLMRVSRIVSIIGILVLVGKFVIDSIKKKSMNV